ncbi:hypothetical protein K456DRAFT_169095 [Colletotrichum gloeosporioides 23]|nr:hypothetical protein K456DRAFT_169095 [Colletotrichum gloeosporioides 23]
MRKKNVSTVSLASHGPPMPVQLNHPSICIWAAHPIRLQRPSFSARGCVPPPLSAARPLPPAAARRPSASLSPPREAAFLCSHPPLLDFIHHPLTNSSDVSATQQSREITSPHQHLWREALALLAFDIGQPPTVPTQLEHDPTTTCAVHSLSSCAIHRQPPTNWVFELPLRLLLSINYLDDLNY